MSRRNLTKAGKRRRGTGTPWQRIASLIGAVAGLVAIIEGASRMVAKPDLRLLFCETHSSTLALLAPPPTAESSGNVSLPVALEARNKGKLSAEGIKLHVGVPAQMKLAEEPRTGIARSYATTRGESTDVEFDRPRLDPREFWRPETLRCRVKLPKVGASLPIAVSKAGLRNVVYEPAQVPGFEIEGAQMMGQFYARDYDRPPVRLAILWATPLAARFAHLPIFAVGQDSAGSPVLQPIQDVSSTWRGAIDPR